MENNNKFFKISEKQFIIDSVNNYCNYDEIKVPKRATKYSAGYDFYSITDIIINPGTTVKIPTGIKVSLNSDCVLLLVPRSSLGFKYKLKFDNTVGVIDSDYINSDNEGHIWASMTNWSNKVLDIKKGDAIFQGIIVKFYTTVDDNVDRIRNGGIGSTD